MKNHDHCHHDEKNTDDKASTESGQYDTLPENYSGTVYTCPMHPQVRATSNLGCPICGMALEPETMSLDTEEDTSELDDMTRRFWISAALTMPLFIYAMGEMIPGQPFEKILPMRIGQWMQLILAIPVVLWGASPFFKRGWPMIAAAAMSLSSVSVIANALRLKRVTL